MAKTYAELAELGRARFQELTREIKALLVAFPDLMETTAPQPAKRFPHKRKRTPEMRERMRAAQVARWERVRVAKTKANGSEAAVASVEEAQQ